MTFLKTNEAQEIILLDDLGYHLSTTQQDLTYAQRIFILKGRAQLEKEREKQAENEIKKNKYRK